MRVVYITVDGFSGFGPKILEEKNRSDQHISSRGTPAVTASVIHTSIQIQNMKE